ncbi:hypothetical protein [Pseudooceanicola sp. LIPI14-2-Ac024]|uniref:hypothetical protein n=1 Tax=Pseudooceanicola sp. LIPI14-2-Ac024 TaxID=3344875 RepID=UPI0035CF2816
MRPGRPRLGRALAVLGLCLAGLAGPAPAPRAQDTPETSVTLTVPQVRAAIAAAAQRGDGRIVRILARGLAESGKADGQTYFLWAAAEEREGDPSVALDAARQAYRLAGSDRQRFQAAQIASRAAFAAEQPTTAQLWLRRTYQHTDDDAARAAIAEDYRVLRAINPLSFQLTFGISPTSNVNNGADSRLNFIDGVPVVGILSPTAQALSGVELTGDLSLGYRLGELRRDRRITAIGRLYTRQVRLSDEARALAPTAENGDFAYTVVQAGVRAQFAREGGQRHGLGLVGGQSWYGGPKYFRFGRVEGDWSTRVAPGTRAGIAGYFEGRRYDATGTSEDIAQIALVLSHELPAGSQLRGRLALQNTDATGMTRDNHAASLGLEWRPAGPVGPVSLSFGVSASYADHPNYQVGFIAVPGGRQDKTVAAEVTVHFDRADYAGFIPTLDVGVRRTTSNVSRFDTREMTVGFGIRSAF